MRHCALCLTLVAPLAMATSCVAQPGDPDRGQAWMESSPRIGEQALDFELNTPEDKTVKLSDLYAEKPVVLEFGCLTCPVYRGKIQRMQNLLRQYGDEMHFIVVYTVEAHPNDTPSPYSGRVWPHRKNEREGVLLSQPTSYEERVTLARQVIDAYGEGRTVLIDGMDNAVWEQYGKRPNSLFLIEQGGEVLLKQWWANAGELQQHLGDAPEAGEEAGAETVIELADNAWVMRDVEYGVVDGYSLRLDAYLPMDDDIHPAVVLIHGGGWRGGDKSSFRRTALGYVAEGVSAFSLNYRLSGVAPYPAAVEDCVAAIRYLRDHAGGYNIDPDRLAAQGGSAGAHLSLMMALLEPEADEVDAAGEPLKNRLVCVASKCGPTDFTADDSMHQERAAVAFLGGPREGREDVYAEASPATHVSPDDPPVLMVHGTEDRTVPYTQAEILRERCEEVGVSFELVTIEGAGHGLKGGDRDEVREAIERTQEFVLEHLLGSAPD